MSRTIAFVCALVSSISSFAQNGNIEPTRQDITIGKNLITNQNINATKITFPCLYTNGKATPQAKTYYYSFAT